MTVPDRTVLTVGHSSHSLDAFAGLLRMHGVTAVADVRSVPGSRFNPHFDRGALERGLKEHGIRHVFLGRELGARPDDPDCYENGRVRYARLARTKPFRRGVERVMRGADDYRVALMCAEKEPLDCHRTVLIAPALIERGVAVAHILADGGLESHDDAMERLLDAAKLPRADLLDSREALVARALSWREERIAHAPDERAAGKGRGMR